MIVVKMAADWQPIDVFYDKDDEGKTDAKQGVWVGDEFLDLDNSCRYGTMWMGPAPDCRDTEGNVIELAGVYCETGRHYLFEVNDERQEIKVWQQIE